MCYTPRSTIKRYRGFGGRPANPSTGGNDAHPGSIDCWTWLNDAPLSLEDSSHRGPGWWAIDTVNANAWPAGACYMARTAADFRLAQEVKVPRGYPREAAEQAARGNKRGLPI